ncbi:MAG: hypothetical protein ACSLFK_17615 [Gemmatimonadaceae bacterium]
MRPTLESGTLPHRSPAGIARWILILPWLFLSVVPLLEGGKAQADAHVEAAGTTAHFAHSHEDCLACSTHRLHGNVAAGHAIPVCSSDSANRTRLLAADHSTHQRPPGSPRAPPVTLPV